MSLHIIDASVAVQWFLPEKFSDAAGRLRKKENELYVPAFFFVEMHSVILKYVRRKEITAETAGQIRTALIHHPFLIHSDRTLLDLAYQIANQSGCSLYDGLYLALAVNLGAQMVTADRRLYNNLSTSSFAKHSLWIENIN